ncbi:LysR family transcriptional regulator [Achromobacter sp. Marseille-Q0513]|uniref:LysR family transcriptional regulator n=1 Tax=Achromobacter sp. Marseille-Q0513 TaxID=2829161 RepID=UPI001B9891D8|nr:LysR family transcriptional regulator [Achromobacter sp. Marseille-Q0513]MBR8656927.1 LysR family transcriptional regulator [Achromobacter sp. Marseille-Q0513]
MSHLDHLHTFIEAYRLSSFSRAAERLGMTQPAASLHIQALEAFVGKPLFLRRARGVTPTDAAHELARAVGPMLDGLQARLASYKLGGDLSGTLHIAGPADFIAARLADGLAPLMAQGLRIRVHTGNRERIYGLLGDASADLAITASLPDERAHGYARLLTERFQLVLAPALAASLDKRDLAAGLASLPLIAYDEDLPLVRPVWNAMFRLPPALQATMTIPDLRIIQDLVIAGHGWSVLPDYLCAPALKAGRLAALAPRRAAAQSNDLYLVWNKGALRNPRTVHARDAILRLFDSA